MVPSGIIPGMTQIRPKFELNHLDLVLSGMKACLSMNLLTGYLTPDEFDAFHAHYWQLRQASELAKARLEFKRVKGSGEES